MLLINAPSDTTTNPIDTSLSYNGKPCPNTPTVTDHEGNVYNTVQIGTQCWTKENLRTTTSPSTGTYLIPPAGTTYTYTGKQARWYDNDSASYAPQNYGLLYNWNAAVDTFNTDYGETSVQPTLQEAAVFCYFTGHRRGICPQGWHVPSDAEWTTLTNYLNGLEEYRSGGFDGYIAKALASTNGWKSSDSPYTVGNNPSGNNASGFTAVPAGNFVEFSFNGSMGGVAYFWSSTQVNNKNACSRILNSLTTTVDREASNYVTGNERAGNSVRCLRD